MTEKHRIEASGDLSAIERAVNDAAKRVNAAWLSLVFLMTYVLISTGKITQKDLFLETPIKMPVVGVDVPLRGYFVLVPAFILALHFYFSVQLLGLQEKFREYDASLLETEADEVRRERLRQRLDSSLFAKVLGGPRGRLGVLLRIIAWTSAVVAPLSLILYIQLSYLPEQDAPVTSWHRIALVADVILGFFYVLPWILRRNNPFVQRLNFETHFNWVLRCLRGSGWADSVICAVASLGVVWFSFLVAIFPWEHSPHFALTRTWLMAGSDLVSEGPVNWFSNRLVLSDQNLIEGVDITKVKVTRSARNRSFVAAIFDRSDLRQVDFTGSDLSSSSFIDSSLQNANLGCAYDFYGATGSGLGGCVQLQGADLDRANLRGASLDGAKMFGAMLRSTELNRASLHQTQLQGAMLDDASFDGANLTFAGLDGASLKNVSMVGASLKSARLRGADFTGARLFGAVLDFALAQNASFAGAQLQWSSMKDARFDGANFVGVAVYGTNVSGSSFEGAHISNLLTAARIALDFGYVTIFPDPTSDSFGKPGDIHPYGTYYDDGPVDFESPQYFKDYSPISKFETDILFSQIAAGKTGNLPADAWQVPKPDFKLDAVTADWSKLVLRPVSDADYVNGLGDRLIVIACAKAGGVDVALGLVNNGMFCPYRKKIAEVLRSGRRPSGEQCENLDALSAIQQNWAMCSASNATR